MNIDFFTECLYQLGVLRKVGKNYQLCPSYEEGRLESYAGRGRVATARAVLEGEIEYDNSVAERVFSCTLGGSGGDH